MPIVTITLRAGRPASEIRAIMDAVHNATVNAFGVPETSRNQRLVEIAPEYLFYPQGRSEDFLTVEVASFPGRSPEQKAALFQQISSNLQQTADIAPKDVMILIHEPSKENWGINGRPANQPKTFRMSALIQIRLPSMPECWESCGNCSDEAVVVSEILVKPGDRLERDDPVITLETDKTTLDIPTPSAGRVTALYIDIGDAVSEGMLILTLQPD